MVKRIGKRESIKSLFFPLIFYLFISYLIWKIVNPNIELFEKKVVIVLGIIALWRYGWQITNYIRALIYANYYYPKLKKEVSKLKNPFPKHIYFVIPSYKEEAWVSIEVFKSILSEINTIPSFATAIVSTGSDEEDKIIRDIYDAHPSKGKLSLIFQRQSKGKRVAMGDALRVVARKFNNQEFDENSVTILMDGDSYLSYQTLQKTIPIFKAFKDIGAVTTDEIAYINTKSSWYKDWFNLKFGQRHILFQSHSLSRKVLTLTGRFSIYRTKIVIQEEFISLLENDIIFDEIHGKFRMLMGDDKSTWYFLLKEGWNMLYIPDALIYSLESRDASFLSVSNSLLYRWYGNTLRNNKRALKVKRVPLFIRYAILDQRLSMWTSLIGITGASLLAIFNSWVYLPLYISWVILVRIFYMAVIAFNGHPVSVRTIPLMLFSQWVGSYVKIKAYYNLSDQNWKKGKSSQKSEALHISRYSKFLSNFMRFIMISFFIYILTISNSAVMVPNFSFLSSSNYYSIGEREIYKNSITPNDNRDDSQIINNIIQKSDKKKKLIIILPKGVIDLYQPIIINRDNVTIKGAGEEKTTLLYHLKTPNRSAILVEGEIGKKVGKLTKEIKSGDFYFKLKLKKGKKLNINDYLIFKEPNDKAFLKKIGAKKWNKKYPFVRQAIVQIKNIKNDKFYTKFILNYNFDKEKTNIHKFKPIKDITLKDFTIKNSFTPKKDIRYIYKNLYPEYRVNSITFEKVVDAKVENIKIVNSGSHTLAFDTCYNCFVQNIEIEGSLNKGKKGNGYLKVSRTFHSILKDISVKGIRHITIQWSSANNLLENIYTEVDINFHGGYTHDNLVKNVIFNTTKHHWKDVTRTPDNASWAPPDGENNRVIPKVKK